MKFTISDCMVRLNQILNYPSVNYTDVSHFFDQAISEINSELHTGLRPISEIYKNTTFKLEDLGDVVIFEEKPKPNIPRYSESDNPKTDLVYLNSDDNCLYYKKNSDYVKTTELYGFYSAHENTDIINQLYRAVVVGTTACWAAHDIVVDNEVDLTQYLPYDWIILFLIPYVCFRYAVRDGDSGATYAEDFGNGFQQLRNSYDIPHNVVLSQQAGKLAYKQDVEKYLPNLNTLVPTRAIYENMRIPRNIQAQYGSVYDRGGWGF